MKQYCVVWREYPIARDMTIEASNRIDALNRANIALKQVYGDCFDIETAWALKEYENVEPDNAFLKDEDEING